MARPVKCPPWITIGEPRPTERSGDYVVLEYNRCDNVVIKFLNTGHVTKVRSTHVKLNHVKDPFAPSVYGVGYLGELGTAFNKYRKAYRCWEAMLRRCYSEKEWIKHPTYKDCFVCKEWHNFSNFKKWFDIHYSDGLTIDKDYLFPGNREYAPDKCIFVTQADNNRIRHGTY